MAAATPGSDERLETEPDLLVEADPRPGLERGYATTDWRASCLRLKDGKEPEPLGTGLATWVKSSGGAASGEADAGRSLPPLPPPRGGVARLLSRECLPSEIVSRPSPTASWSVER